MKEWIKQSKLTWIPETCRLSVCVLLLEFVRLRLARSLRSNVETDPHPAPHLHPITTP